MPVTGPYENERADSEDVADAVLADLAKRRGIHLLEASTPIPTLKVNIYFIERPVPTLIDAPSITPSSLGELDRKLKHLGYNVDDIEVIIVTHPHFDHFGLAGEIARKSGAKIWATRDTADWLENFDDECREEEQFQIYSLERAGVPADIIDHVAEFFQFLKGFACVARVSRHLEMNEMIELDSGFFRVEHVPGHTPWCIMMVDAGEKIAFSGDFLLKDISSNPLIQRPWKVPDGYRSLEAYASSLERVAQMDLRLILPGHGGLIKNPGKRITALLGFINDRARQIMGVLRKRPGLTVFEIAREIFPELPRDQIFLAVSEIVAHLEILEHKGVAACRNQDSPVRFMLIR